MFLKTVESLIAHELFEGMREFGGVQCVGGRRPAGVVMVSVGHGDRRG